MAAHDILMSAAGLTSVAEKTYIEDVFSTYLYTGTGTTTQDITNGIDLAANAGLVWCKSRNSATVNNALYDTVRGVKKELRSNATTAETTISGTNGLLSFNNNGFSVSRSGTGGDTVNLNGDAYVSWTFRKAPKFFDVLTYTGNGVAGRTVSHNLGSVPGMIIVKGFDGGTTNWFVYHRSLANNQYLRLNGTDAVFTDTSTWNVTTPTATEFTLGSSTGVNNSGQNYVAYLFAHDTSADGIVQCGSYTGNGTTLSVTLGWEPQYLLVKGTSSGRGWWVVDNIRGMPVSSSTQAYIGPHLTSAESSLAGIAEPNTTGFTVNTANGDFNASGQSYIYLAIRRGPMRTPTDATKVFQPVVYTGTNVDNRLVNTTIAPDMVMVRQRNDTSLPGLVVGDRLRGQPYIITGSTGVEGADADSFDAQLLSTEYGTAFSAMNGFWVGNDLTSKMNGSSTSVIAHAFKRAPSFLDIVCYSGTGVDNQSFNHNLTVAPELIIIKNRTGTNHWLAYTTKIDGTNDYLYLSSDIAKVDATASVPTSSVFYTSNSGLVNASGSKYVAYLFASCPGVSKIGTYTGNGLSEADGGQNINCGFSNGARYVLIKRTDSTGDWCVFDSARGIVVNFDPTLFLNVTNAETSTKSVNPLSSGFSVGQNATTNINVNAATYLYLAIA